MSPPPGPNRPRADEAPASGVELEVPPAFAKDGVPYTLDELLSGLPAVDEQDAPAPVASPDAEAAAEDLPPAPAAPKDVAETEEEAAADGAHADREDEWDPSSLSLGNIVAALHALADDSPPPAAVIAEEGDDAGEDDSPLVLGDAHQVAAPAPEPEPEPKPEPLDAASDTAAALAARVETIIAAHSPAGAPPAANGDAALPERLDALALLLSDPPPADDFAALDALYACWPRATLDSHSRALLAAAYNLGDNFGLPEKLPMATTRAWRMLSPTLYETELAQRLADVGTFIAEWQRTQHTFLILEFGEVELIEYLFEALHPGTHADLLAGVMNFKVLSNRRMGLLRRIPPRLKKQISAMLPAGKDQALVELSHAKALLLQMGNTGFAPIADTAAKAVEEIDKLMKAVANIGAPPPPAGGMPLGRIG